jgi:hypothetical protein
MFPVVVTMCGLSCVCVCSSALYDGLNMLYLFHRKSVINLTLSFGLLLKKQWQMNDGHCGTAEVSSELQILHL